MPVNTAGIPAVHSGEDVNGLVKNLIHEGDLMAVSQIEPLADLGLDFATFTDGESETKISGEFVTLTKKLKSGGSFAIVPARGWRHYSGWGHPYPQGWRLSMVEQQSPFRRIYENKQPLNELAHEPLISSNSNGYKSVCGSMMYHIEVGVRRMFPSGTLRPIHISEAPDPQSYQTMRPGTAGTIYCEQWPWGTRSVISVATDYYRYARPIVSMGTMTSKSPVSARVAVGGRIRAQVSQPNFFDYLTTKTPGAGSFTTQNPDNLRPDYTNALTVIDGPSPIGLFSTAYSASAPARSGGALCYGLAHLLAPDGALYPGGESMRSAPYGDAGPTTIIRYTGVDKAGHFATDINPIWAYDVLDDCLTPHFLSPIVSRVGPSTLVMVVHSSPTARLKPTLEEYAQQTAKVFEHLYEYHHTDTGLYVDTDVFRPKASATSPENFSFLFWSKDNGRTWTQIGDGLWHYSVIGYTSTWNSNAMLSMAGHMMRHTVFLQDTPDACMMLVALPHCIDLGYDLTSPDLRATISGYVNIPSFVHHRPNARVAGLNYNGVVWDHAPHDKAGLADLVDRLPGVPNTFTGMSAPEDALFNTQLWRWAVFRVTKGSVQYLTSLPAEYPPCDYAVSRTSGVTKSQHFVQLKPVYSTDCPSVLLVSSDRGLTWKKRTLPTSETMPNGSGVGLVFAEQGDTLIASIAEQKRDGAEIATTVKMMSSSDGGKTWRRYAPAFSVREDVSEFVPYPGGYPIYPPGGGTVLWVPSKADSPNMTEGWFAADFVLLQTEDGQDAPINPCRPWLNDDSVRPPS